MDILLCVFLTYTCCLTADYMRVFAHQQNGHGDKSETMFRSEPCSVGNSFLFTREDASPGSNLMKLATYNGEEWTLLETEPIGYLTLDKSEDNYNWVIFSKSPDLETISKSLGRRRESLQFVLVCTVHGWIYKYKQDLIISDVNEHAPSFDLTRSFNINVTENTNIGSSVFSLRHLASDPDTTGQIAYYSLEPWRGHEQQQQQQLDGRQYFHLSDDGNHLVLYQSVDYEKLETQGHEHFKLNLSATDNGTPFTLSSFITLTVRVIDVDDQGPAFVYSDCHKVDNFCALPYFQTSITCGFQGLLQLYPGSVHAIDRDTQNHSILYSISRVEPDIFLDKLTINKWTGDIQVVSSSCSSNVNEFVVTVTATENSILQHSISSNAQVKFLDSLMFSNMAWKLQVDNDQETRSNPSLSLTIFLVAIFVFLLVGSVMAFVAVRISRKKKQNKISSTCTVSSVDSDDYQMFQGDTCSPVTYSQTCCSFKCNSLAAHSCHHNGNLSTTLTSNEIRPFEIVSFPPRLDDIEPQEMWTTFNRIQNNNSVISGTSQFLPSPSLPGHSDMSRFCDGNSSIGSMKHERIIKGPRTEAGGRLRQTGGIHVKCSNMVPVCFKSTNQRVAIDMSNLSQSSV